MRRNFLTFLSMLLAIAGWSQDHWTPVSESALGRNPFAGRSRPADFKLFTLNESAMKSALQTAPNENAVSAKASSFILTVPDETGQPEQFRVVEAPMMQPGLAAKFPEIKSYSGVSLQNPANTIRFTYSKFGFSGVVLTTEKGIRFIERIERKENLYVIGLQSGLDEPAFECSSIGKAITNRVATLNAAKNADDMKLRIYRLALAANWMFSDDYSNPGDPDATRRADVMVELTEQMTTVNAIFERDFGARLVMIDNNEDIIFLDSGTDPFPDGDPGSDPINTQAQTTITDEIGSANFDIGHLVRISTSGDSYGNAGAIGSVCNDATKARGFTTRGNWDATGVYSEIMLTHEFGHQAGANHVFTHQDDNDNAQMEPGSGSTIMSYGGGSPPVQYHVVPLRDHYFAAISIQQATDYLKGQACGNASGIANQTPTANAGSDYTIPKSTPFRLTGTSSDPENGGITHTWEQMDKLTDDADFPWVPTSTHTKGPEFRSRPPVFDKFREFPILASILDGTNGNDWEVLPSVARTLNFRFTVRDNAPGNGQNESDDMLVTVDGEIGPFAVTSPNGGEEWCPGPQTVTWSVNGSETLAANVKISLSTDGGLTFPTVLAANTPNDGSHEVNFPCVVTETARIKIEAIDNIFFDISNASFSGDITNPTFTAPANITIYKDANCDYDASTSITGDVTDESDNCDNTLNAVPTDDVDPGSCEGEEVITRTWTLTDECGNTTIKVQTITIADTTSPSFTTPADITIYKDENCDHDASVGVTGDVTDEADNCDTSLDATFGDVTEPGSCIGEEIITRTWTLTDDCGNSSSGIQTILVRDTTRPVISNVGADPNMLWPPNHKMRNVTINYTAVDNCSPVTNVLSVTSNEPVNGIGDGNTSPDWVVIDDHHVQLRAERAGNGSDRIYTITITSTDDCGNVATATTTVVVPHNLNAMNRGEISPFSDGLFVKVMPNPTRDNFTIEAGSDLSNEKLRVLVFDMFGRKIEERIIPNREIFSFGDRYLAGAYILEISQGLERKRIKLIKAE